MALAEPTGQCLAGHFCEAGAKASSAEENEPNTASGRRISGACPPGFYCVTGTELPVPCLAGTYCPRGSALPSPCEPGTYNMEDKQESCNTCPQGFTCTVGGVADFSRGTFYATEGLHACADTEGGNVLWETVEGTSGTDLVGGVVQDKENKIIVSGSTTGQFPGLLNAGGYDVFVMKHDEDGNAVWKTMLGSFEDDYAGGLALDSSGSLLVGVRRIGSSSQLVKLNGCGEEQWRQNVGNLASGSRLDVAVGGNNIFVMGKLDIKDSFVTMFSSDGTLRWTEVLGLNSTDLPKAIRADDDGNCYVAGETTVPFAGQRYRGGREGFLMKINDQGVIQWTRQFGTSADDWVGGLTLDGLGSVFVVGDAGFSLSRSSTHDDSFDDFVSTSSPWNVSEGHGGLDLFVVKYWTNGTKGWSKLIGTNRNERGEGVTTDVNGNVYVLGFSDLGASSNETFVVKLSPAGEGHWTKVYEAGMWTLTSFQGGISARGDGLVVVAGMTSYEDVDAGIASAMTPDLLMTKYSSTAECIGISEGMDFVCPLGHFCPAGLQNLEDGRCPRGTFGPHRGLANISQCSICTEGMYCGDVGLASPSGSCSPGFYCTEGAADAMASTCDARTVTCDSPSCAMLRSRPVSATCGGSCPRGSYCPLGSPEPTPCPPGYYCGAEELSAVSGQCKAGYFCELPGSGYFTPDGTEEGRGPCPAGFYCPTGTIMPISCPIGTYSSNTKRTTLGHCSTCPAGYYCPHENLTSYTPYPCAPGYYCPAGSIEPRQEEYLCPIGHSCPGTTPSPRPCTGGYYQDQMGQSACKLCLPGFYCPGTVLSSNPDGTMSCPAGHFCDSGFQLPTPCPEGTFQSNMEQDDCDRCPYRYTCERAGTVTPRDCPAGYYCGEQNSLPLSCPIGTYSDRTNLGTLSECQICPPGKYCATTGLNAPTGSCLAGHFCATGAGTADEVIDEVILSGRRQAYVCPEGFFCVTGAVLPTPCPAGTYCVAGSKLPSPCDAGTYNMQEGQPQCSPCPAGYTCILGGIADYAQGTFYATAGLHACADPLGGSRAWQVSFGSGSSERAEHFGSKNLVKDRQDNVYVAGWTNGAVDGALRFGGTDAFLIKYDRDGVKLWAIPVGSSGSDVPDDIAIDSEGHVILAVRTDLSRLTLHKFDPCGFVIWETSLNSTLASQSHTAIAVLDTFVHVVWKDAVGKTYVGRYSAEGIVEWTLDLQLLTSDTPRALAMGSVGGGYVVGEATGPLDGQTFLGQSDIFVVKFDYNGGRLWTRLFGSTVVDVPRGIAVNLIGELYIAGYTGGSSTVNFNGETTNGGVDAFLAKYSPAGDLVWTRLLGSTTDDQAEAIDTDDQGNVYISGYTDGALSGMVRSGLFDLFVAMYTPAGEHKWTQLIGGSSIERDAGVAAKGDGVVVVGSTWGSVGGIPNQGDSDVVITKFVAGCIGLSEGQDFVCPEGYFCMEGMNNLEEGRCPLGTYSDLRGLETISQCKTCPAGQYCGNLGLTAPSGSCMAGWTCTGGAGDNRATVCDSRTSICDTPTCDTLIPRSGADPCGTFCVAGTYCPVGSYEPTPCPKGYYCDADKLGDVTGPCPAGYYCEDFNTIDGRGVPCIAGHYCLEGSIVPTQCPRGSSSSDLGNAALSSCQLCPAGFYCPDANSINGITNRIPCIAGYYCPAGSYQGDADENLCPRGHTCIAQSGAPDPCPASQYQELYGQTTCKDCFAGAYCPGLGYFNQIAGDYQDRPDGGSLVCQPGGYCPPVSDWPIYCDPGFYNPQVGSTNASACLVCPRGFHCNTTGLGQPSGPCHPGYYCPTGTKMNAPPEHRCPRGYECPEGSAEPRLCRPGTFSSSYGAHSCELIRPGYFVNATGLVRLGKPVYNYNVTSEIVNNSGTNWTITHVVGLGDLMSIQWPKSRYVCPNTSKYTNYNFTICDANTLAIFGECDAGYYCSGGSPTPRPLAGSGYDYGDICPSGSFCIAKTNWSVECPPGWYQELRGKDFCNPVPAGFYTPGPVRDYLTECPAGYYCGFADPIAPQACPLGTFVSVTKRVSVAACIECPPGMYCEKRGIAYPTGLCEAGFVCGGSTTVSDPLNQSFAEPAGSAQYTGICPAAHYCPAGTSVPIPCPAGTWSNITKAGRMSDCLPCPPGRYCDLWGMGGGGLESLPLCGVGYYCPSPDGALEVVDVIRNFSQPDWTAIVAGVSSIFLPIGQSAVEPIGHICPAGHACPTGSWAPDPCCDVPDNYTSTHLTCSLYQPDEGRGICLKCPASLMCIQPYEGAGWSREAVACPKNYYCNYGKQPVLCPDGYYGHRINLTDVEECTICPSGKWCTGGEIKGDCLAGHICSAGAVCAAPGMHVECPNAIVFVEGSRKVWNSRCPAGSYCPEGTPNPIECPAGTYLSNTSDSWPGRYICDCIHCAPGEMCKVGSPEPEPCPQGYFCLGTYASSLDPLVDCASNTSCGVYSLPTPCPGGTYNPLMNQTTLVSCLPCGAVPFTGVVEYQGYYCPGLNNSRQEICPPGHFCLPRDPIAHPCPGGWYRAIPGGWDISTCSICRGGTYCPNGTVVPIGCPPGRYCEMGSAYPTICEGGLYCPPNSTLPLSCPAGTYCEGGNDFPVICGPGTYCPFESTLPTLCPFGTYSNENVTKNRTSVATSCSACPRGTYGADLARLQCDPCFAGHLCYGNTTRGDPTNISMHRGEICPAGYWCGVGSWQPVPCDAGTFSAVEGARQPAACTACPRNSFNAITGQAQCIPCGSSAVSTSDSLSCQCKGANRVFHAFDSACRCRQGYTIYNSVGQAQPLQAQEDGVLDCSVVVLTRCAAGDMRALDGTCLTSCADTQCTNPPCYCDKSTGTDFCATACPSFQTATAELVQVDTVVGTAVVCSCACAPGSTDPKCADPNQTPIATSYAFSVDKSGQTVLQVIDSTGTYYYQMPGLATDPAGTSNSQFIGSSPTGFSGVLDMPLSFLEQLGAIECAYDLDQICQPITNSNGTLIRRLLSTETDFDATQKDVVFAGPAAYHAQRRFWKAGDRRRGVAQLRAAVVNDANVVGVQSPMLCIKAGEGVMWSVTSSNGVDHYPQYVPDSLFNTNKAFDYGAFVGLGTQVKKGYPVTTFYHTFDTPGIYTFRDAGDASKETVIGVVDAVLDCPRAFEQNPIQPMSASMIKSFPTGDESNLVITPDYALIFGIAFTLIGILFVSLACLYVRKVTGWGRSAALGPDYRKVGEQEDFHSIASKRQRVRKGDQAGEKDLDELDDLAAGYVDLEGFNVQMLFDKLQDQTHLVAEQLTQQKQDVREFYDKVTRETVTLRALVDKHNSSGFSSEAIKRAEKRRRDIDRELRRRKELGGELVPTLTRQRDNFAEITNARMQFTAIFDDLVQQVKQGVQAAAGAVPDEEVVSSLQDLIKRLHDSFRQLPSPHASVNVGSGAVLLDGARHAVNKGMMVDTEGTLKPIRGLLRNDEHIGIIVPSPGTEMKVSGRHVVSVPENCCIHPETGHVIPIEGNVYIDVMTGTFAVGSALSAAALCESPLPYICNRSTGSGDSYPSSHAPYAHLVPDEDKGLPLNDNRDMIDPFTGLRVPVLGVTTDFRTGKVVAVGGAMMDPETRLMTPIRIGNVVEFEDPESGRISAFVIMGVKIDPETARVAPLAGRVADLEGGHDIMVRGVPFRDEFSGEKRRVMMCVADPLNATRVLPLDDDAIIRLERLEEIAREELISCLEKEMALIRKEASSIRSSAALSGAAKPSDEFLEKLSHLQEHEREADSKLAPLRKALDRRIINSYQKMENQCAYARDLAATGGQKGKINDPVSEKEMPLLIGCPMYDEQSKHDVLVLAVEEDEETGFVDGLGCTVVDPVSGSTVAATIGGRMRDASSGESIPITSVHRDPSTFAVLPDSTLRGLAPTKASHGMGIDAAELLAGLLSQLPGGGGQGGKGQSISDLLGKIGGTSEAVSQSDRQSERITFDEDGEEEEEGGGGGPGALGGIGGPQGGDPAGQGMFALVKGQKRPQTSKVPTFDLQALVHEDSGEVSFTAKQPGSRMESVFEKFLDEDVDDDVVDEVNAIRANCTREREKLVEEMHRAQEEVMGRIDAAMDEVLNDKTLDEEAKEKLLDDFEKQQSIMAQLLEHERKRQEALFERQQADAAERRLRKFQNRKKKDKELEELAEAGEISTVDRAAARMEAESDVTLEDEMDQLQIAFAKKRTEEIAKQQVMLLQTLQAADDFDEKDLHAIISKYESIVDNIEARQKAEMMRQQDELEKKLELRRKKKLDRLREQASQYKSKSLWKKAGMLGKLVRTASNNKAPADAVVDKKELIAAAHVKHSNQEARLEKALDEQAEADKTLLARELAVQHGKEAASMEESFLQQLENAGDDDARARILQKHAEDVKALKAKQDADKERQMQELQDKLAKRKAKKLKEGHNALKEKELALLESEDPEKRKEAELVGLEAEALVRHEYEAARLENALTQQEQADMESVAVQARVQQETKAAAIEAELQKNLLEATDDDSRTALLNAHEVQMARLKAEAQVAKGKAEDDLQARLAARRAKKKQFLDQQHEKEMAAIHDGTDRSKVEEELEQWRNASAVAIRHEEEAASTVKETLVETQSELRNEQAEIKAKNELALAGMKQRLEDSVADKDMSAEERARMLREHEIALKEFEAKLVRDEAAAMSDLEAKLHARKAKKQKKLEASQTKELAKIQEMILVRQGSSVAADAPPKLVREISSTDDINAKLDEDFAKQEEEELARMRERMEKQKEKMLAEEMAKLEQMKSEIHEDMSESERAKLLEGHSNNLKKLEGYMDKERQRQEDDLKAQLAEKKKKKAERMTMQLQLKEKEKEIQKKQQEEYEKLQAEQEKERVIEMERVQQELNAEKQRELARITAENEAQSQELIKQVAEETTEIERSSSTTEDKERMLKEAEKKMKALRDAADQDKYKRELALEEQLAKKRAKKAALLKRKQEAELENKMIQHVDEVEKVMTEVNKQVEHLEEEEEMDEQAHKEAAAEAAKASEAFHQQLAAERARFEEEMKAALAEQEQMRKEMMEKQSEERKRLEEEMARDAEVFAESMKREQEAKLKELEEKKAAMQKEIESQSQNLSAEERDMMIKKAEADMKKLEQEEMAKKKSMDDELEAKLRARRDKKKKQQEKKQKEEMAEMESKQKSKEEEFKKKREATEGSSKLAYLKKLVSEGDEDQAVLLLKKQQQNELDDLRAAHSADSARELAMLEDESQSEAKEAELKVKHDKEVAELKKTHANEERELLGLAPEVDAPETEGFSMEDIKEQLDREKQERMAGLTAKQAEFEKKERAKMEAELKRMEEDLKKREEELDRQRVEEMQALEQKRSELESRAKERRAQMEKEMLAHGPAGQGSAAQTQEDVQRQYEAEAETLSAALNIERERQDTVLKEKLERRRQQKLDEVRAATENRIQENVTKMREGVMLSDLDFETGMTDEQSRHAKLSVLAARWNLARVLNDPIKRAADKWMFKVLKRGLTRAFMPAMYGEALHAARSGSEVKTPRMNVKLDRSPLSMSRNPSGGDGGSPFKRAASLMRAASGSVKGFRDILKNLDGSSPRSPGKGVGKMTRFHEDEESSDVQAELAKHKKKADELEQHARALQKELDAVRMQVQQPPQMAKEQLVELLKESPLSSKLEEVEVLLRKLLQREAAGASEEPRPPTGGGGTRRLSTSGPQPARGAAPKKKK